jgi:hypothetical protein
MDQDSGVLDTITPSEPILVKAAMEHLCEDDINWPTSIRTLMDELLEKGLKGELYSRLVVILAHDWVRWSSQKHLRTAILRERFFNGPIYRLRSRSDYKNRSPNPSWENELLTFCACWQKPSPRDHPWIRRQVAMQLAPDQPTYGF